MPAAPPRIAAFPSILLDRAIRRPGIRWVAHGVFVNTLELRTPAPPLRWVGTDLSFVLFHDMGNAFEKSSQIWPAALRTKQPHSWTCRNVTVPYTTYNTPDTCDFNDFSHAVGLGLRYHTPIGPVRGDFSYNLNPPIYPDYLRLHHGKRRSQPARRAGRSLQLFLQYRAELLMTRDAPALRGKETDSPFVCKGVPLDIGCSRPGKRGGVGSANERRAGDAAASTVATIPPAPIPTGAVVLDHVVAVINGSVILQSDVNRRDGLRRFAAIRHRQRDATRRNERCSVSSTATSSCNKCRPRRRLHLLLRKRCNSVSPNCAAVFPNASVTTAKPMPAGKTSCRRKA